MLIGREQEYAYLEEYMKKPGSQMVVFYGQKFMGKTSFLLDFCEKRTFSYCLVHSIEANWMRHNLNESINELAEKESDEKKILIVDEFQGFAKDEQFMATLFAFMQVQNVLVVLVSSEVNWVETLMVKSFGRSVASINGFYKCRELSFESICELYPEYNRANLFIMYSIFGGIPGLWNYFDEEMSIEDNIVHNILSDKCSLRQIGYSYSMTGLRESGVYDTILLCMANGNTKLNNLYNLTGFSRAKISVYLKTLMEQEQINKVYSIDCVGFENSQKGIYDISNHFTAFWFKFIYLHEDKLQLMDEVDFYNTYIKDYLLEFCGKYLREVVKEYFIKMGMYDVSKKYSPDCFLGKKNTIGLAWKEKTIYHIVSCSQIKIMTTYEDYETLVQAADEAKMREREYYIVSFRDFDEKLTLEARMKENVHLLSFTDILEQF